MRVAMRPTVRYVRSMGSAIVAGIWDPGFPGRGDATWKKSSTACTRRTNVASETTTTATNRATSLPLRVATISAMLAAIPRAREYRTTCRGGTVKKTLLASFFSERPMRRSM
jgi:hypothetical protein